MRRRDFIFRSTLGCAFAAMTGCANENESSGDATPQLPRDYETDFSVAEEALSENGAWTNAGSVGIDWKNVRTTPGFAFGTQTGTGGYDDSVALLSGFPPNHSATGVIVVDPKLSGDIHEVEIWLRGAIRPHYVTGYECNLAWNGSYCTITRWDGPFGKYTQLAEAKSVGRIVTGDRLSARIVGHTITVLLNGSQILRTTDKKCHEGNPGIGFYREKSGTNLDMGFSRFTATTRF